MTTKSFYYSQIADLRIEGVGPHASFSINLNVTDDNRPNRKWVYVSATGKTAAAKAAGSGSVLFWCNVRDRLNNKIYKLDRHRGEYFAIGINDSLIGSVKFKISKKGLLLPVIEIEDGYIYDGGYVGSAVPFPSSMKRKIVLTQFDRHYYDS
ncbi:hypothetical protein HGT70_06305 [Rosenbergiella collisarenosi]|uniref:hypothetical protein n=1 Tax=Rosenbergiella collisarenosi TaxID=1544695 RepID=UPI001BDA4518|nr:hypothetical protein [Rosenbergiella collisarenosi]MBT0720893.1 hypothetical protein [Rosenbergiella collisarenosi]